MSEYPLVYRNGKLVPKWSGPRKRQTHVYVISDTMEPAKHMGTGKMHDSKSQFRADTKASGCVEIGNEPIRPRAPIRLDKAQRREAIQRAVYDLRNGSR